MSFWDNNPYYNPQTWELKIVAELEKEPEWDFDKIVVWKDKKGNLYWAEDSGCSCPSPFEDYNHIDQFNKITQSNFYDFSGRVMDWGWSSGSYPDPAKKHEFILKVKDELS